MFHTAQLHVREGLLVGKRKSVFQYVLNNQLKNFSHGDGAFTCLPTIFVLFFMIC